MNKDFKKTQFLSFLTQGYDAEDYHNYTVYFNESTTKAFEVSNHLTACIALLDAKKMNTQLQILLHNL